MARCRIFRLVPFADETDPRWDNAPFQGEVIVRARSAAEARILASQAEVDFREVNALPGDGVDADFASAFRDAKLYHVEEDHSGAFDEDGDPAVLAGALNRKVIKPLIS